jgi:hypothetical protein
MRMGQHNGVQRVEKAVIQSLFTDPPLAVEILRGRSSYGWNEKLSRAKNGRNEVISDEFHFHGV